MIPYGRQNIIEDDIAAVRAVLESDFLTQGKAVPDFEKEVAGQVGADHGIAVSSGTAALHLACLAVGVGPGDWVWTSPLTFVASANCALYCGAKIDFVDIDADTGNLSPQQLEVKLATASANGALPKALVLVHYAGLPAERARIAALTKAYSISLIEDAAHALGARDALGWVGDGHVAAATTFSFHPVKLVTTGEGGMITTGDPDLARRLRQLRAHGVEKDSVYLTQESPGAWYYEQQVLGFNYRMTDIQAALGLSQMARLDAFVARRRALAERYRQKLAHLPITLPQEKPDAQSAWHLFVIRVDERARVFASLRERGIGVQVHYLPVHLHPYYRNHFEFQAGDFPAAEQFYEQAITLPLYPDLSENQQDEVIAAVEAAL